MRRRFGPGPSFRSPRFWPKKRYGGGLVYCPKQGRDVPFAECAGCPDYGIWEGDELERCRHEYEKLKSQGYFADSQEEWESYLRELDPETYRRVVEERETRERVLREMEAEKARGGSGEEGERRARGDEDAAEEEKDEDEDDDPDDDRW